MCDISIPYIAPLPIFSRSLPSSSHSFPSPGSFALLMFSRSSLVLISHTEEIGPMMTTDGAVALFLASLRTCHRPANTIKAYTHDLRHFVTSVPVDLADVSAPLIQTFLA